MTITTVEVEEVRTIEEEVVVCDECGREVDEHGETFIPSRRAERKWNGWDADDLGEPIHFCSDCLSDIKEGIDPPHVRRAKECLDSGFSLSIHEHIKSAHTLTKAWIGANMFMVVALVAVTVLLGPVPQIVTGIWAIGNVAMSVLSWMVTSNLARTAKRVKG